MPRRAPSPAPPWQAPLRCAPAWAWALAVALPLAVAYLIVAPPSADLAAASYRSALFSRVGFTIWDTGWYGGHALPSYSLLSPALGAWLGLRALLALSAVAGSIAFGVIAPRAFPPAGARAAAIAFALCFCFELPSGRVPYDLGVALALCAVAALGWRRLGSARLPLGLMLALAATGASPLAGAFLALAGLASALGIRDRRAAGVGVALAFVTLAPIVLLALAFPEGGYEPFSAGAMAPELAAALAIAALLGRAELPPLTERAIRSGAMLYALALVAAWAIRTPVGANTVRLGELLGPPLLVGALWQRRRLLLLGLAPLLSYWALYSSAGDEIALAGDPSVNASFYSPLRVELRSLARSGPIRVEVVQTGAHWEAAYLPGDGVSIARGWDRQLDTRYASLFYRTRLTASAYRAWLARNAVSYVALPRARLDYAGVAEGALIRRGPPYLRQIWHSARWRLFAVRDATPLAQPPSRMTRLNSDSFSIAAPRAGAYEVRLRFTPYWAPLSPGACVAEAPGGFTEVRVARAGTIRIAVSFSLSRVFSTAPRC